MTSPAAAIALAICLALVDSACFGFAAVLLIQPIGVLGLPIAVLASAALTGRRPALVLAVPIAACVGSVATFVWLSAAQQDRALSTVGDLVATELIVMALVRGLAQLLATGWTALFSTVGMIMVVGLAAAGLVGGWLVQRAYASGPAEVVIGCDTVVDPMVAVLIGFSVLGEGGDLGTGVRVAMIGCGLLALAGVVALARHHPEAVHRRTGSVRTPFRPIRPIRDRTRSQGADFRQQHRTLVSADRPAGRVSLGAGKEQP